MEMSILSEHICGCGKCELKSAKLNFVASGAKTEYRVQNKSGRTINKYIVDDCLLRLRQRHEKCDYLFIIDNLKSAYFIECKGSDVLKAVNQIQASINMLAGDLAEYVIKARIVPTKVFNPDLRSQSYRKLREKLKGDLIVKNIVYTEIV
jgi:hypothetical protein